MEPKNNTATASRLQVLYEERLKTACETALQNDGQVPAGCMESLSCLQELASLIESTQPTSMRKHAIALCALLGTLTVTSVLLFLHSQDTEIGLDLAVSELGFTLNDEQLLSLDSHLVSLGVSGLQKIELSDPTGVQDRTIQAVDGSQEILLALHEKHKGSIMLPAFKLPAGTRVRLRAVAPQRYRLALDPPKEGFHSFSVNYEGPVRLGLVQQRQSVQPPAGPAQTILYPGNERLDLDLEVMPGCKLDLAQQWRVRDISLTHIERFMDASQTTVRNISSVLSGRLYMDSLNGERRVLRAGEGLQFKNSIGDLRRVSLETNPVSVQYQGSVRGMSTGFGETRTNLMPTLLEWLRARHGLSLLWGTTLYIFGIVVGVLRWSNVLQ
jgi:hypothetical protein